MKVGFYDLSEYVGPVRADSPAGDNVRQEPYGKNSYRSLRDLVALTRRLETIPPNEPRPEAAGEEGAPTWGNVAKQAGELLARRSKDMDVAIWMCEAMAHELGFPGLHGGLWLMTELCDRYWPLLHPRPDGPNGSRDRVRALEALADPERGIVAPLVRRLTLIPERRLGYEQYEGAQSLEALAEHDRKLYAGIPTLASFREAAEAAGGVALAPVWAGIEGCGREVARLKGVLDQRLERTPDGFPAGPSMTRLEDLLGRSLRVLGEFYTPPVVVEPTGAGAGAGMETAGQGGAGWIEPRVGGSALGSRAAMLAQISEIAAAFRRAEPHSPVSYLLEQAVRWGGMSLPDMWKELLQDEAKCKELFRVAGINKVV